MLFHILLTVMIDGRGTMRKMEVRADAQLQELRAPSSSEEEGASAPPAVHELTSMAGSSTTERISKEQVGPALDSGPASMRRAERTAGESAERRTAPARREPFPAAESDAPPAGGLRLSC